SKNLHMGVPDRSENRKGGSPSDPPPGSSSSAGRAEQEFPFSREGRYSAHRDRRRAPFAGRGTSETSVGNPNERGVGGNGHKPFFCEETSRQAAEPRLWPDTPRGRQGGLAALTSCGNADP